jgi:hypothetical protein
VLHDKTDGVEITDDHTVRFWTFRASWAAPSRNAGLKHVPYHRNAVVFGHLRHDGTKPSIEVRARNAAQLQCKRHNLLGEDMRRSGGRRDGIDHAFAPERGNGK